MKIEEWLGEDNKLGIDIWKKKYQYNGETFDQWLDRVSAGDEDVKKLIKEKKFLFGGRTLANRGIKNSGSYFNCYSRGFVEDDYKDIMQACVDIGLTFKAQGGQGISLSKLRPKDTPVGDSYTSDGIKPFMKIYNEVTAGTSQGGSRKGALMLSIDARHKEAETFIRIKSKDGEIEKANLSLEIDDEFMGAVKEYYDTGRVVVLHETRDYSGHIVEYDVTPIEIFKMLVDNSYHWGDPACLFVNRFRNYNLMEYDDDYQIETSNPCGEQPLPKHFACCLSSVNLAEFVINPYTDKAYFDMDGFVQAVSIGIKALDKLIDENYMRHPLKEQQEKSFNYRNVGLGCFGYAGALMKLGIRYGSKEALDFTHDVFSDMFRTAVLTSAQLAKKYGSFPKYKECVYNSQIIKLHFNEREIAELKKCGLRNCSVLSIAPTGSLATMLGESGGCEPEFAIKFTRRTVGLTDNQDHYYDVYCKTAKEYMKLHQCDTLPDYFVGASEIDWRDRVKTQAEMQNHVDTAISSTVNLPNSATKDDIAQLYIAAWEQGCKGITIFRDGCERAGILTTSAPKEDKHDERQYDSIVPTSRKTIGVTSGKTYCKKCACGTLYITVNHDDNGNVLETFINTSKGGICQANINAVNRMISTGLRAGVKVEEIVDQLKGITCPACIKVMGRGEKLDGISCSDILARTLLDFYKEVKGNEFPKTNTKPETTQVEDTSMIVNCPDCGANVIRAGGCVQCTECGWSKCN